MTTPRRLRFRWSPVDGPELRCPHCAEWWSVGADASESWVIGKWSECRACLQERWRVYQALRALDPEYRAKRAARTRRYKAEFKRAYPDLAAQYDREMTRRSRARARDRAALTREKAA